MPEKPKVEQWIETELWNFAHALALDLGLPKSAEDVIHRSMASVIHIAPTPAPEPTPVHCPKCNAEMQTLPATIFCPVCDRTARPDLKSHLEQALKQWRMYANGNDGRELETCASFEGEIYREAKQSLASAPAAAQGAPDGKRLLEGLRRIEKMAHDGLADPLTMPKKMRAIECEAFNIRGEINSQG